MNKTKYNQLKEEIIKANKDIVALKKGCYVKDFLKGTLMILAEYTFVDETPIYDFVFFGESEVSMMKTPRGNWEIIGRDITIGDVIIAINKKQKGYGINSRGYFICREWSVEGVGYETKWNEEGSREIYKWEFNHSLQWHKENKPEVIDFLHSLIVKKCQ